MKLISCIFLMCVFFLAEAGRVPNKAYEISNDETTSDVIKNTRDNIRRSKRYSRYYSWLDHENEYINMEQDERIAKLETIVELQGLRISELLSRPNLPLKVYVVQESKLSSKNETYGLGNKFGDEDQFNEDRPISYDRQQSSEQPIQPPIPHDPIPPEITTEKPKMDLEVSKTAILICCDKKKTEKKECFKSYKRLEIYHGRNVACSERVVQSIIKEFIAAYTNDDM